jgi:GT2 family glycosyltransferase
MKPQVAAIVVTYRQGPELASCLQSLQRELAGTSHEMWIVDNASGDGTADRAIQLAPTARVVRLARNVGFAAANNVALEASQAEAFLLINPDAQIYPGAYAAFQTAAAAHADAGAVAPQILSEDGRVVPSCFTFPSLRSAFAEHLMLDRMFPRVPWLGSGPMRWFDHRTPRWVDGATGACLYVPRRTLEVVGFLDPGYFMYSEETDWCRRMRDAGLGVWFEPSARVLHLGQRSSRSSQHILIPQHYRSQRRYFRKHLGPAAACILRLPMFAGAILRIAYFTAARLTGRLDATGYKMRVRAFTRVAVESLTAR